MVQYRSKYACIYVCTSMDLTKVGSPCPSHQQQNLEQKLQEAHGKRMLLRSCIDYDPY
jgi:hypothetical protein